MGLNIPPVQYFDRISLQIVTLAVYKYTGQGGDDFIVDSVKAVGYTTALYIFHCSLYTYYTGWG